MSPEAPVFISYSRKDYYFAESLAFHLLRAGVPAWLDVKDLEPGSDWERGLESALDAASTVLLVVSPNSIASERVRAEWQRAHSRGCRIIIVCFRPAPIPPELRDCAVVDFRGRFAPALSTLTRVLADDSAAAIASAGTAWPAVPPWIGAMTLTLALPTLGYFLAASWKFGDETQYRFLILAMLPFGVLGIVYFFCVAFLRRRMGMTRLALCLLCLAFVFGFQLQRYLVHDPDLLADTDLAGMVSRHWRSGIFLMAAPLVGLLTLVLLRPEDLLRWTPTGKAWAAYRLGHVANAAFGRAELAFQLRQIRTFTLVHDPADAPMAQRLREHLLGEGATEASAQEPATQILLLSNRVQLGWIDAETDQLRSDCVAIVGTGIGLPPELDWLWRRQWIDFRAWSIQRSEPALALPQVPDAVTQTRLPRSVARVRHVLCAIAAVVFTLSGALMPDDSQRSDDLSAPEVVSILSFAVAVWWGIIAHRLVKRSRTAPLLFRDTAIAWAATAIAVSVDGYALTLRGFAPGRVAAVALFLAVAWIWLARQRAALAFWLPQENLAAAARRTALGRYRDWSTLLWSGVYAMLWMWTLGLLT